MNEQAKVTVKLAPPGWLDHQLAPSLKAAQRRMDKRAVLAAITCALGSALGATVSMSVLPPHKLPWSLTENTFSITLATLASLITAAGLYIYVRRQQSCLLRAASAVAHNNIEWLAMLGKLTELRDPETNGHNLRVTLYAVLFGEALRLPPEMIVRTVKGALLHDIGKLIVPDRILCKAGPLDEMEREVMKRHVEYGLELVIQADVLSDAMPVIAAHHERFDGTGYPKGTMGEDIPFEARMFALIDVFDALTSKRVYKPTLEVTVSLALMQQESGSHFDPELLEAFVELAPGFSESLPQDEAALTKVLRERLRPYLDYFTGVEPVLAETRRADRLWVRQPTDALALEGNLPPRGT